MLTVSRVGYGTAFATNGTFAWRFPLALSCLFPLVLLIGLPWVPESPRWRESPPVSGRLSLLCSLPDLTTSPLA